jgi:hypothetical protein
MARPGRLEVSRKFIDSSVRLRLASETFISLAVTAMFDLSGHSDVHFSPILGEVAKLRARIRKMNTFDDPRHEL